MLIFRKVAMHDVRHNQQESRFEVVAGDDVAHTDYEREGNTLTMVHTEVPESMENRGIASALVSTALDYAESEKLTVVPRCSYVRAYIERHPERQRLLAPTAS